MASPYDVLGVDRDADRKTVERRYRELVKEVHPDAGGSAAEFKRVKEAYREIVDDRTGTAGEYGGTAGSTGGTAGSTGGAGSGDYNDSYRSGRNQGSGSTAGGGGTGAGDRTTYVGRGRGSADERRSRNRSANGTSGSARGGTATGSTGSGKSRRWVLFGLSTLVGAGALAHRDGLFSAALAEVSGDSDGSGESPQSDTVSREVGPNELFDVPFEASAGSEVHFTVDGADSSDWVKVYTESEYERVAEQWADAEEFDPGDPLDTVLTGDGYVSELPEDGTYMILVKLWSGPPDDQRDPREVEVAYEIRS